MRGHCDPLPRGRRSRIERDALDHQVRHQRRAYLDGRRVDVVGLVHLLVQTTGVGEGVDGVRPLRGKAVGEDSHISRPADGQGRYLACVDPGRIAAAGRHVVGVDGQAGDARGRSALVDDVYRESDPLPRRWLGRVGGDALDRQVRRGHGDVHRAEEVVCLVQLLGQAGEVHEGVELVRPVDGEARDGDGHGRRLARGQGRHLTRVGPGGIAAAGRHVVSVDRHAGDARGGRALVAHAHRDREHLGDLRRSRVEGQALDGEIGQQRWADVDGRREDVVGLDALGDGARVVYERSGHVLPLSREAGGDDGDCRGRARGQGRREHDVGPGHVATARRHVIGVDRQGRNPRRGFRALVADAHGVGDILPRRRLVQVGRQAFDHQVGLERWADRDEGRGDVVGLVGLGHGAGDVRERVDHALTLGREGRAGHGYVRARAGRQRGDGPGVDPIGIAAVGGRLVQVDRQARGGALGCALVLHLHRVGEPLARGRAGWVGGDALDHQVRREHVQADGTEDVVALGRLGEHAAVVREGVDVVGPRRSKARVGDSEGEALADRQRRHLRPAVGDVHGRAAGRHTVNVDASVGDRVRLGRALVAQLDDAGDGLADCRGQWIVRHVVQHQVGQQRADGNGGRVDVVGLVILRHTALEVGEGVDGVLALGREG